MNPDGFQGDERDVLLYSLSYDATNMEQAALSARQTDRPHIQGMLNVAFTRAREEMHVFHSAPIEQFGMASGEGAIKDWLAYCAKIETTTFNPGTLGVQRAQSEFEVEVMEALRIQGLAVVPQYPSCGFFIDLVAQKTTPLPRYLAPRLREALADTPAVLIHGPRQSDKTTLARLVGEPLIMVDGVTTA